MKPRLIFVCSMGDLFHEDVDPRFLREVLATMRQAPQHTFQVLTKRPNQIEGLLATGDLNPERWPRNAWLGVTVENDKARERIPVLSRVAETLKAPVRFISAEPLLENLNLSGYVNYVDWLIVGGETGPEARPMQVQWARELRGQMRGIQRAFFFKGWGSHIPAGQEKGKLDGMEVHEYPA
jgi:protein gp37